jgi:acetyltransferase-like isoleucine patch superfamily enzyme
MLLPKERLPIRSILLIGFLPNFLKKFIYRLKGYKIGRKVSLGLGSVIIGKDVQIGDYTSIGFLTTIRGTQIKIGSHVMIGATTILDTPNLEIGDGSRINEQVFVGGLQFPDSKLVVGKNCQIMQMSFINPARSIHIGDDTGIGGHSLIFGHSSWLSQLEGYPVEFQPIEIGKSVSLAWRVFVLPGAKIGDGAVIGADSLVNRTIPPRCLAAGFPARVVSKYPEFPQEVSGEKKKEILQNIVKEMAEFFIKSGLDCAPNGVFFDISKKNRSWLGRGNRNWRLQVMYERPYEQTETDLREKVDVLLSLKEIPDFLREICRQKKIMWIDIEKKEQPNYWNDLGEEVTMFLKRYGVRLSRV